MLLFLGVCNCVIEFHFFCMLGCVYVPKPFVFFVSPFFCGCTDCYMLDLCLVKPFSTSSRYLMHAYQKPDSKLCNLFQDAAYIRVSDSCTIHTTMGDIQCKLFAKEWVPLDLHSILLHGVYQKCIECVLLLADLFDMQFVWNVNQQSLLCCFSNDNSEHLRRVWFWDESVCFTMAAYIQ